MAHLARRLMLGVADPPIRVDVGGIAIEMPFSHQLPFHLRAHPDYGLNIGRLSKAITDVLPHATGIDVGANVGDTAATIRIYCRMPLLCVEGNSAFLPFLRENADVVGDIEVDESYVATAPGAISGHVETVGGTARIVDDVEGQVTTTTLAEVIARHPRFRTPALVKIDTDGFDCRIITAHVDFWRSQQPVLFFEYDPKLQEPSRRAEEARVFETLRGCGYRTALLWDNFGEYHHAADLDDRSAVAEAHEFASRRDGRFLDVAAFPASQAALAERVRLAELEHFRRR